MLKDKILFLVLTLLIINLRYIQIDKTRQVSIVSEDNSSNHNVPNHTSNEKNKETNTKYIAYLKIPKINLYKGLVNINSVDNYVDKNIQIINGSDMPDIGNGTLILAAHSGNSNVSFFKDLNKLEINDSIYIEYNRLNYEYKMVDYYIVEKTGLIDIVKKENINTLILITCIENVNKQIVIICEIIK